LTVCYSLCSLLFMPSLTDPLVTAMVAAAARYGVPRGEAEHIARNALQGFLGLLGDIAERAGVTDPEAIEAMVQAAFRPPIHVTEDDFTIARGEQ